MNNKQLAVLVVVYLFNFSIIVIPSLAQLLHLDHNPIQPHNFTFLVVGDWGRRGGYSQPEVAYQMGLAAKVFAAEFVISTGDNFYEEGLKGENDPAFEESFTNIYNKEGLMNKPWYVVLGNHDYYGDSNAQLSPALTQKDSRWICHRAYIVTTGIADFFFVDTTPMVNDYFQDGGFGLWDHRLPNRMEYNSDLINHLDIALQNSSAQWKIVVGHHTMVSEGAHGATEDVVRLLEPTLFKNNVDFYFNGHDHCLQIAKKPIMNSRPNNIQFVTSGGGSRAWVKETAAIPPDQDESEFFYYGGEGFVMAEIIQDNNYNIFALAFYDIVGQRIHTSETSK